MDNMPRRGIQRAKAVEGEVMMRVRGGGEEEGEEGDICTTLYLHIRSSKAGV